MAVKAFDWLCDFHPPPLISLSQIRMCQKKMKGIVKKLLEGLQRLKLKQMEIIKPDL